MLDLLGVRLQDSVKEWIIVFAVRILRMVFLKRLPTLKLQVGIEPTIFRWFLWNALQFLILEGGRDIHFATGAGKYANR